MLYSKYFQSRNSSSFDTSTTRLEIASLEVLLQQTIPTTLKDFLIFQADKEPKDFFVYFKNSESVYQRFYPSYFLSIQKILEIHNKGTIDKTEVPLASDVGGQYLTADIRTGSIFCEQNLTAKTIEDFFQKAILENDQNNLSKVREQIDQALETNQISELQSLLRQGYWHVDEFYKYGNTIADMLLTSKSRRHHDMLKMLIAEGAQIPRFDHYASKSLTDEEINFYKKHKKLP